MELQQRVNSQIIAREVRLIGEKGEQHGIVSVAQALTQARDAGLDLVEVSPHERPPVVRILDIGKFRYEKAKRQHKNVAHQSRLKEVRLRPKTDTHDIEIKIKQVRRFLEARDKVQLTLVFRGRELAHLNEGHGMMERVVQQLEDIAKVETPSQRQAKRLTCILVPR